MNGKNIILAISPGTLRDELLLQLGHLGAKAFVTEHQTNVVKLLKTKSIDCILTQMMLKNEDTIELVLKIRDINSKIPVILIDRTDSKNHDLAKRLKVAAYFEEPVSAEEVYNEAENILTAKQNVII